jgi:hypothetical protein
METDFSDTSTTSPSITDTKVACFTSYFVHHHSWNIFNGVIRNVNRGAYKNWSFQLGMKFFRDNGFSDLIHRPVIKKQTKEKHNVSETGSVSVLRWGKKHILLGPLDHVVFFLSLFFNTRSMDKVWKSNISESYTPSSESSSNYMKFFIIQCLAMKVL